MVYKDKNYRDKRWIDKEIKEGSVVEQSKVFKCNSRSFYGRSKATDRGKVGGKRLNGGLGREAKSAARMEHQEYREVQAGTRDKEGSSGNKGEDKRILKGLGWQ